MKPDIPLKNSMLTYTTYSNIPSVNQQIKKMPRNFQAQAKFKSNTNFAYQKQTPIKTNRFVDSNMGRGVRSNKVNTQIVNRSKSPIQKIKLTNYRNQRDLN